MPELYIGNRTGSGLRKTSNSTIKYMHNNTATVCFWLLRSLNSTSYGYSFRSGIIGANLSAGFAPGFVVG